MILTDEQKRMYEGDYGPGTQKAMSMLIEYGQVFGAEKMVQVSNAHTGLGGGGWFNEIMDGVARVRTFTTTHAGLTGACAAARAMGFRE